MDENKVQPEIVRRAVQDADVHEDFKQVIEKAAEKNHDLNLLKALMLFVDHEDHTEGVESILRKGNPTERALAKGGVQEVHDTPEAAIGPDDPLMQLMNEVEEEDVNDTPL